jgi:hypothetical protein
LEVLELRDGVAEEVVEAGTDPLVWLLVKLDEELLAKSVVYRVGTNVVRHRDFDVVVF